METLLLAPEAQPQRSFKTGFGLSHQCHQRKRKDTTMVMPAERILENPTTLWTEKAKTLGSIAFQPTFTVLHCHLCLIYAVAEHTIHL